MFLEIRSLVAFVYLLIFCYSVNAQQSVKLVFPPPGKTESSLAFRRGEEVRLSWTCTSPIFTLQVWQGPDDEGTKAFRNLLSKSGIFLRIRRILAHGIKTANTTNATQNYQWRAENIAGMTGEVPMHIRILNPADKDCESCQSRSVGFTINRDANSTLPAPLASTLPLSSASASTKSTSPTPTRLELGLGLGLGLPLLISVTALITWLSLRRRWPAEPKLHTVEAYETDWRHRPPPAPLQMGASSSGATTLNQYYSPRPKTPEREADGSPIVELQPELMRHEAPRDAERIELEGNVGPGEAVWKWI